MLGTALGTDRLQGVELFAPCARRELRVVERLATVLDVAAGRRLCTKGEIGRECFVVLAGVADVLDDDGGVVASVGVGEPIGEMAVLAASPTRTATVVASTPMTVLVFSRRDLTSLLDAAPCVGFRLLRIMTTRLLGGRTDSS
ncbi:MAG TPA: cyclic nucleotide-binding domain-containing protein [Acidimicrobiia bacterium]|nr:cyclic nucleotide-binding domain-containing protein [Acidimicrobiia bacterium]